MITPFVEDVISQGNIVKGETKAVEIVSKLFKPEEEIVEREIKRPLTKTPEEFAAQEQEDKGQALSRYFIKKALRDKLGRKWGGLYACPGCLERKELELYRVNKNGEKESDYILLCGSCRQKRAEKRKEEKKANRKWRRRYVKGDGSSKISFYNKIRKQVYKRDGYKCVFCEVLGEGKSPKTLGLAPLIPESKGGERCVDNYVACCAFHRPAKGDKLPLNYIWEKISFDYWMSEQLSDEPVVKNPGARVLVNMHLVAEIQQYFHRIAAGEEIDRSKAERLAIKLSETDEDRRREREQILW
ncbi:hypothetical protein ES702_01306 [subsurface metagenome]